MRKDVYERMRYFVIEKIINLMSMEFVENARNVLFIGSSGVGKTHLTTGLGV